MKGDLLEKSEVFLARSAGQAGRDLQPLQGGAGRSEAADYYKDKGYAYVNSTPETTVNEKTRRR
jgi:hypothetical protein